MVGETISRYQILAKLGEGGMGVVYRAEDTRLKRQVALKFLPAQAGVSQQDRERFWREAQAAAALDHPNICTIYEVDEVDGRTFLAMAYLEGRTLDVRISDGPLPLKEALEIARQTAEGLQAAHNKGVVHRDIKPSNLMLTSDTSSRPSVKILDFGLAQLANRSKLTQTNSLMGTVAYMSPEQTQGQPLDSRTDVWSLGVVLYEMLAGETPFKGHYEQATMYSILNEDPQPLTSIRSGMPIELDWIVEKCLAKEPGERYRSMGDLLVDLTTLEKKLESQKLSIHRSVRPAPKAAPPPTESATSERPARGAGWGRTVGVAVAAMLVGAALAAFWPREAAAPARRPLRRVEIQLPAAAGPNPVVRTVAVSPDGNRIAFALEGPGERIWLRDLSQPAAYTLDDTAGARRVFWSPDGEWIGFRTERALRKISSTGGPAQTLVETSPSYADGAAWSPDGESIIYIAGPPFALLQVPAVGGQPKPLFENEDPSSRRGLLGDPQLVGAGDSRLLLYSERTRQGEEIAFRSLSGGDPQVLIEGDEPFFAETPRGEGFVLYRGGPLLSEIWALPFSLQEAKATGAPIPLGANGGIPTASPDGTLVFAGDNRSGPLRLVLRDTEGRLLRELANSLSLARQPTFSPDGQAVALVAAEAGETDLWTYGAGPNGGRQRLTFTAAPEGLASWSPSGDGVLFVDSQPDGPVLVRVAVDGSATAEPLTLPGAPAAFPTSWSANGDLAVARLRGRGQGLLRRTPDGFEVLPLDPPGGRERRMGGWAEAHLSPDGAWIAGEIRGDEGPEVYLAQAANPERRMKVSTAGGESPRWAADSQTLFYVQGDALMRVRIGADGAASDPEALFQHAGLAGGPRAPGYDVSPDGETFVFLEPPEDAAPPTIRVILNWPAIIENAR